MFEKGYKKDSLYEGNYAFFLIGTNEKASKIVYLRDLRYQSLNS